MSIIMLLALNTIFIFPAISLAMLPLYVRNILHLVPLELGWLMAVIGTGAFFGAVGLLTVEGERRLKFMTFNVVAIAAGVVCMAGAYSFFLTALAMGLVAFALSMYFGLAFTLGQVRSALLMLAGVPSL